MKKFFAVAILAVATLSMNAQDFKKFRFGPAVGMNVAKVSDASSKIGFNVGARAEYNFSDNFYLGSGLLFTQKGFKLKGIMQNGADLKANPFYLEIPINAGYRYNFSEKFSVFGEVGPYIGFGIAGKYKAEGYESAKYFGDEGAALFGKAKRFDMGIGFAAGCEFSKFQVRVGYELGLTKVFPGGGKNKNLTIGVAYMF